jgi:transcriptional pleiotropic regulator of transition state genes
MKAMRMVKAIDELGRLVLPKPVRKAYGLDINTYVEIFADGRDIIIRKYEPSCVFCDETDGVAVFKGKHVCKKCVAELAGH